MIKAALMILLIVGYIFGAGSGEIGISVPYTVKIYSSKNMMAPLIVEVYDLSTLTLIDKIDLGMKEIIANRTNVFKFTFKPKHEGKYLLLVKLGEEPIARKFFQTKFRTYAITVLSPKVQVGTEVDIRITPKNARLMTDLGEIRQVSDGVYKIYVKRSGWVELALVYNGIVVERKLIYSYPTIILTNYLVAGLIGGGVLLTGIVVRYKLKLKRKKYLIVLRPPKTLIKNEIVTTTPEVLNIVEEACRRPGLPATFEEVRAVFFKRTTLDPTSKALHVLFSTMKRRNLVDVITFYNPVRRRAVKYVCTTRFLRLCGEGIAHTVLRRITMEALTMSGVPSDFYVRRGAAPGHRRPDLVAGWADKGFVIIEFHTTATEKSKTEENIEDKIRDLLDIYTSLYREKFRGMVFVTDSPKTEVSLRMRIEGIRRKREIRELLARNNIVRPIMVYDISKVLQLAEELAAFLAEKPAILEEKRKAEEILKGKVEVEKGVEEIEREEFSEEEFEEEGWEGEK